MLPPGGSICERLTWDLPLGCLQCGVECAAPHAVPLGGIRCDWWMVYEQAFECMSRPRQGDQGIPGGAYQERRALLYTPDR